MKLTKNQKLNLFVASAGHGLLFLIIGGVFASFDRVSGALILWGIAILCFIASFIFWGIADD